jgi:hypothetical protein
MSDLSTTLPHPRRLLADRVMIYAIWGAGVAAAMTVSNVFWFVTPFVAFGVASAGRRAIQATLPTEPDASELPWRVEVAIQDAVAKLPSGDARRLLGDVVRQARPLFGAGSSHFDESKDNEARAQAATLVIAACDTALELSRLDTLIESGDRAAKKGPRADADLVERYKAARSAFATRLTDAARALGSLYASGVEHGTPASDLVAELATELSADAEARAAAVVELERTLR